ncbi:hypothetical protein [Nostoc sp. CALU 1950]|uniref:hypothetical protein n=1 Tax=Nostoc sp. CALU 1950 TaxID=3104321 RepID=UPI003EB988AD
MNSSPASPHASPTPYFFSTLQFPKIHISPKMMIKRGQKPGRFSYQRVKTGEDESPGYWW